MLPNNICCFFKCANDVNLKCLFFQMWILFDESRSGIFLELKLLDITLLYGQGFFSFLAFGLDNDLIFAPALYK